jgi:hypothetical protein
MQNKLQIRKENPPTKTKPHFSPQSIHAFTKTRKQSAFGIPLGREREKEQKAIIEKPCTIRKKGYLGYIEPYDSLEEIKEPFTEKLYIYSTFRKYSYPLTYSTFCVIG